MKSIFLTTLRDKSTGIKNFREASHKLGYLLAQEIAKLLEKKQHTIETPLAKSDGVVLKNDVILVPILRSGVALLHPFLEFFENAKVGFVGLQRDEKTAVANLYYHKLPEVVPTDDVVLLDPMIATGGSAIDAIKILKEEKIEENKIKFAAVIASREGLDRIRKEFPKIKIVVPHVDEKLNDKKFIVPGLGDFGDRFFGTE
jgi:uracil phosphoribosyltransferase